MPKYKKMSVEVEAFQVTEENACVSGSIENLPEWIQSKITDGDVWRSLPHNPSKCIIIDTPDTAICATVGDYIVQSWNDKIYAVHKDEFEQTHTLIEG